MICIIPCLYQTHNSTYIKLKAPNFKNIYHLRHMHPFKSQKVSSSLMLEQAF